MRTKILLLILSLTMYNCYAGKGISPQKAQTVAETYYHSITSQTVTGKIIHADKDNSGNTLYYIIDMGKSGFVIVSGIDVTHPIVAISTNGNYKSIPKSGIGDYLYNLHDHISKLYKLNMTQQKDIASEWDDLSNGRSLGNSRSSTGVLPLLTTTWNQSPYYNQYCPGGSVTGCVATAMAQILKFWNYPASGTGSYSYSDPPYGTLSSRFDSAFSWALMPADLTSSAPQKDINAVASLMYKLGVSVAMQYSPSGSGAAVLQSENPGGPCAQYSFVNYFGYNASTIQGLVQSNYTTTKWDSIINVELNNDRPIEYVGFGSDGGHTWVLDGYNSSGLYDMNWGWGGLDDGFFALNNLDPSGIPLSSNNAMLIGIEPSSTQQQTCGQPTLLTASGITTTGATITWAGVGSPKSYTLNYEVSGASSWTSITNITSPTYALTGLVAGTTYNVEVQQVCSATQSSSFTSVLSFNTTQLTCGEPTSLAAGSISDSSAVITWVGAGSPKSYNLNYQLSGASSWTSVTGITSPTYALKGLVAGSIYNIEVQQMCTNSATSGFTNSVSFTTLNKTASYCTSSGTTTAEYIKSVSVGTISNTVTSDGGYHNYTDLSTGMKAGVNYQISLTPGFASTKYSEAWQVYIDYNHTDNFVLIAQRKGTGVISGPIKIPTTAVNGSTRMRIVMHRSTYATSACSSFTNGDVQDYTVVISGGSKSGFDLQPAADDTAITEMQDNAGIAINVFPNPTNGMLSLRYLNDTGVKDITLIDASGRILLRSSSKLDVMDLTKYAQGWYILAITGNDGSVARKLVMVTH